MSSSQTTWHAHTERSNNVLTCKIKYNIRFYQLFLKFINKIFVFYKKKKYLCNIKLRCIDI